MKVKRCTKCGHEKSVDHFTRAKTRADGFDAICRACAQIVHRAWRTQLGREKYTPETAS